MASVVVGGLPSTLAATALCTFSGVRHDSKRPIGQNFHVVNGSILDIKERFEYLFGEHTFPSLYVVFCRRKIVQENVCFFNVYRLFEDFVLHTF